MRLMKFFFAITLIFWSLFCKANNLCAESNFILLGSTTSTENSGFYQYILPIVKKEIGIEVRVVAVGTGKAMELGKRGDVDILLVHAKEEEEKFIRDGHGIVRKDLMFNEFFIVGPAEDLANIKNENTAHKALEKIRQSAKGNKKIKFISRGDNSGTHKKELKIWKKTNAKIDEPSGKWYLKTGSSMGKTLIITRELNAYTLTDSATWLSLKDKYGLKILYKNKAELFNQYGIILLKRTAKKKLARKFFDWAISIEGKKVIENFEINEHQGFFVKK